MDNIWYAILAGFVAQLIDGTLGMAYGLSASSLLLTVGIPPAVASATVHAAEVFATGASALSHHHFGNVDKALFKKLALSGIIGAVLGSALISYVDGDEIKPFISWYLLLMGIIVIVKAFRPLVPPGALRHVKALGFVGAFLDTVGGGGWGPIVASSLMAQGGEVRKTVGTVNASEFLITLAATITFMFTLGITQLGLVLGLAIGGVLAAPLGAYFCKRAPIKPLMAIVGILIIFLSLNNLHLFW